MKPPVHSSRILISCAALILLALGGAACGGTQTTQTDRAPDSLASVSEASSSSSTTAAPMDVVTVAARSSIDASPIWIADSEGFFEARGIDIAFVPVADEPAIFRAIANGTARAGVVSAAAALERQQRSRIELGLQVYLDATDARLMEPRGSMSLIGIEGTTISTGCDLEGRRVGVDSESSLSAVSVRQTVINDGCDPYSVQLVVGSSGDRLGQLRNGELDAAAFLDPDTARSLRSSTELIANLDNELCPDYGRCPLFIVVVRDDWRGANVDTANRFSLAVEDAIRWITENEIEYRAALVSCCAITTEDAAEIRVPSFVVGRNLLADMTRLREVVIGQLELGRLHEAEALAAEEAAEEDASTSRGNADG